MPYCLLKYYCLFFNPCSSLETRVANHPNLFISCSSIRESLGLFLSHHHLLDALSTMLESEVPLVEIVFSRIKIF